MIRNTHESYDRQTWNRENHADRIGWNPGPYDCRELKDFLRRNPGKDSSLLRRYIGTQDGTGARHDGPQSTPF